MNKNDCDRIGYILSITEASEEARKMFFELDERIESEFDSYNEIKRLEEKVDDRFKKIMTERFGCNWMIKRGASEYCGTALKQAKLEACGDEL